MTFVRAVCDLAWFGDTLEGQANGEATTWLQHGGGIEMKWEQVRVVLDYRPAGTTREYRGYNDPDGDAELKRMGEQGWELVGVTPCIIAGGAAGSYTNGVVWGFFKRPAQ
jgi:hypothetical protein